MRTMNGIASMAVDARVFTGAEAPGAINADFDKWGGTTTSCVGGHLLYGPFTLPATAGDPVKLVLDESIDWRDRLLWVRGRLRLGTDIRPGTAGALAELNQRDQSEATLFVMDTEFYTGMGWDGVPGTPRGGVNNYNYNTFLEVSSGVPATGYRIYSDATNGHRLTLWNNQNVAIFGTLFIIASEPTGKLVAVP